MNKKPKLIIFEGVDGVGKTTIYQAFRKATTYGPLCIDRFIGSNFAYDAFFKRGDYINYFDLEDKLKKIFDCVLVYLTCEEGVLMERIRKHDEKSLKLEPIREIKKVDLNFYFYYKLCQFRKIIIDTTHRSVEGIVSIIIRFIESDSVESDIYLSCKWKEALESIIF